MVVGRRKRPRIVELEDSLGWRWTRSRRADVLHALGAIRAKQRWIWRVVLGADEHGMVGWQMERRRLWHCQELHLRIWIRRPETATIVLTPTSLDKYGFATRSIVVYGHVTGPLATYNFRFMENNRSNSCFSISWRSGYCCVWYWVTNLQFLVSEGREATNKRAGRS